MVFAETIERSIDEFIAALPVPHYLWYAGPSPAAHGQSIPPFPVRPASVVASTGGTRCYGEDNHYVYGELLGMSAQEIATVAAEGVI